MARALGCYANPVREVAKRTGNRAAGMIFLCLRTEYQLFYNEASALLGERLSA